jgi:hypothetical protein
MNPRKGMTNQHVSNADQRPRRRVRILAVLGLAVVGLSVESGCARDRAIFQPGQRLTSRAQRPVPRTEPGLQVRSPFVDVQVQGGPALAEDPIGDPPKSVLR